MGGGAGAGTALLRDAWPWTLLSGAAAVAMLYWAVQMLEWAWWGPRRMDRVLRTQGIRGTQYRFLHGDLKEDQRLMTEAWSRPVPMDRAHAIAPRVAPLLHRVMEEHGKVSFTWFGPCPRIAVGDPALVREVLSNKFGHFEKTKLARLSRLLVGGLAVLDGEKWAKRRRIMNPAFHAEKLKRMLPSFSASCSELIGRWENSATLSVGAIELDIWSEFQNLSGDVISRAAFGVSNQEAKRIFLLQTEQAERLVQSFRTNYIPGFSLLPTENNRRMKAINIEVKEMLRGIIEKRQKSMKDGGINNDDLLGLLLEANMDYSDADGKSRKGMTMEDVIGECKLFYFAGMETTAVLLTWTVVVLSMHPEWQDRAREEVLQVFGKNVPDLNGLNRLKIVTMIFNEVLRLYPPVVLINRRTYKTIELGGVTYPPDVMLTLNIMSIHRDPGIWGDDCDEFNPGRFSEGVTLEYELPHVPPWFFHANSQRLYFALAGMVRLVGLSTVSGQGTSASLSVFVDILLNQFRRVSTELRAKDTQRYGVQRWYMKSDSGQMLRQASSAVCMLNELIYGLSDQSLCICLQLFNKTSAQVVRVPGQNDNLTSCGEHSGVNDSREIWKISEQMGTQEDIIQCIGSILHEYMSPEVWDLPTEQNSELCQGEINLPLHLFRDTAALQQVMLDGIGVFGIILGQDFARSGFMHSSLYLLLRKLISSSAQIRIASDAVLRTLAASGGYSTVGQFVVANADYIVDSLCRQLRHLDLNPHVPDILASMLCYIGASRDILPFLEEPIRAVSSELEVLGRHDHPHLTVPFLKAVSEISKACSHESISLPDEVRSFYVKARSEGQAVQNFIEKRREISVMAEATDVDVQPEFMKLEYWEDLLCKLNDMRRYRRIVGSLVGSCLSASTPLLSSTKEAACLETLDIVENAVVSIAKVEEAYKCEIESKAVIEEAVQLLSLDELDDMDAAEDVDENRLLPAMNKLWPYLVICLKNKISVPVVRRCTEVLSRTIQISGGDFFVRRFHKDGYIIWRLLALSPFRRRTLSVMDEKAIILPYRNTSLTSEEPMAEISSQKIQIAVLDMITEISSNKRSAVALESVLKKICGLVVGIAYGGLIGLREAAIRALTGLACMDADLVWLLLADVYHSLNQKDMPLPPIQDLVELYDLLPPPMSSREYLFVQYGGDGVRYDIDPSSVHEVFKRMEDTVFK